MLFLECSLRCDGGYKADETCAQCVLSDICEAVSPCQNGGTCTLDLAPLQYTCQCENNYIGTNCTGIKIIVLILCTHFSLIVKLHDNYDLTFITMARMIMLYVLYYYTVIFINNYYRVLSAMCTWHCERTVQVM